MTGARELLRDCKVIHIGSSDIKDGGMLVFIVSSPRASRDVIEFRDYIQREYNTQDINIKAIVWRDTLLDVKLMVKQEMIALRDILTEAIGDSGK